MKILIVEDDPFKLKQLRRRVEEFPDITPVEVACSLQEAMATLSAHTYDVVLLDMAIPSHAGTGSGDVYSQPVGGLDVLLYLSANERDERVIILTQYPTVEYDREHVPLPKLRERLAGDGVDLVLDVILFSETGDWKVRVGKLLESMS